MAFIVKEPDFLLAATASLVDLHPECADLHGAELLRLVGGVRPVVVPEQR